MSFIVKSLNYDTLGSYLRALRAAFDLDVETVSSKTNVPVKYINALENGKFYLLPADVYTVGIIQRLARVYSVSPDLLISQYKKERIVTQKSELGAGWRVQTNLRTPRFVFTGSLLTVLVGFVFVFSTVGYLVWQVATLNSVPKLVLSSPKQGEVLGGSFITFEGETEQGNVVTINGQSVFVNPDGKFKITLGSQNGQRQFSIVAVNKLDKKAEKLLSVVVDAPNTLDVLEPSPANLKSLVFELEFLSTVSYSYSIDGLAATSTTGVRGLKEKIVASKLLSLSTDDAGKIQLTLNGERLGFLGSQGEKVVGREFGQVDFERARNGITPLPTNYPTTTLKTAVKKSDSQTKPKPSQTTNTTDGENAVDNPNKENGLMKLDDLTN